MAKISICELMQTSALIHDIVMMFWFSDHCGTTDGYNCLSEMRCIPREYVCDGQPDCVLFESSLDELTGCGKSSLSSI